MTINYGKHTKDERSRSRVHAYGDEPRERFLLATACGARLQDVAYVVAPREFGRLMSPPAEWCEPCDRVLDYPTLK